MQHKKISNNGIKVAELFSDIHKIMKRYMRSVFDDCGVTVAQSMILSALVEHKTLKVSELSSKVNLSNSTVSGILNRLEKQGLVERTRNSEDRRAVFVSLTDKFNGGSVILQNKILEGFADLICDATEEELADIVLGLETLKRVLENGKEL